MTIFYLPKQRETSSAGIPLAFAKLYFYKAGTTTDQTVYTTAALNVAHAQPVVADATGTFPTIYLDPNAPVDYRVQLKTVLNALVYDQDNYPKSGVSGATVFSTQFRYDQTAVEAAALITPTNYYIPSHDAIGCTLPARYGNNTTPGTTDMTSALQSAATVAAAAGCEFYVPPSTYGISSTLTINSKISMRMASGALIKALATFPNPGSVDSASWIIDASNANVSGSTFYNICLHGLAVAKGLQIGLASDVLVSGGLITNMRGPAVYAYRCSDSVIENINATSCGIDPSLSGSVYTTSIRMDGLDTNNRVDGNVIRGCRVKSSGGKSIAMAFNNNGRMEDNYASGWTDSYALGIYVSTVTNIAITNNILISSNSTSATVVVKFSNDSDNCILSGGYLEANTDIDIIHIQNDINTTIKGVTFKKTVATSTSRQHIKINDDGVDTPSQYIQVLDNVFFGHGNTDTTCFATPSTVSDVTFIGNTLRSFAQGIQLVGANSIVRGNAYNDVPIPEQLAGGSNPRADYSYNILRTTSDQTATGAGPTTLSLNLPAGIMDRTRQIRVKGSGTKTGAVGNKTISFRFGSTDFTFNAAANDTNSWYFEAEVTNVSETSQRVHGVGFNAATALPFVGTAAENTATTLTVGVRANPAGAGDTVVMKMLTIELLP